MTRSDRSDTHHSEEILTAGAPAAAAEAAIVLLHGRGATAQGVINLFEPVSTHGVTVLAPQGRRSRWVPNPVSAPIERNEPWLTSAVSQVDAALEMAQKVGVSADRTVIAGFSQGAAVAAEFAFRRPQRYGGVFVLSGSLPGPSIDARSIPAEGSLAGTPIRLDCSDDDPSVPIDRVRATLSTFEAIDGDVTIEISHGTGHAVTEAAFEAISSRLSTIVSSR